MVDYIRLVYEDKVDIEEFILIKENFEKVHTVMEYHSGQILYPYRVPLESMIIIITNSTVYIKNSLHKLYNKIKGDGEQNYSDFKYTELAYAIEYLNGKLIGLLDTKITQLEFGLNINTNLPAEVIIRENVKSHKGNMYNHNREFRGKGEYIQYDNDDYYIKIYDKAKQFGLTSNILRFEIKFIRKRTYNKLGLHKLSDLQSKDNLQLLFNHLLKRFDEMVIVDNYTEILRIEDKEILEKYLTHEYWQNLKKTMSRQTVAVQRSKFKKLLLKYDMLKTKSELRQLLSEKFEYLINN